MTGHVQAVAIISFHETIIAENVELLDPRRVWLSPKQQTRMIYLLLDLRLNERKASFDLHLMRNERFDYYSNQELLITLTGAVLTVVTFSLAKTTLADFVVQRNQQLKIV